MDYSKKLLENFSDFLHDVITCEELSSQEIYNTIKSVISESRIYHKKQASRSYELLMLLNGHKSINFDDTQSKSYESFSSPTFCDKDDPSPECKNAWNDFWEDSMPPWGHSDLEALSSHYVNSDQPVYTEEELDAMCDAAAEQEERDKCREYNLREAEYYTKRAMLDAEMEAIKAEGGFEWTPDPVVSRNDESRLKYEHGWVYESPDGGKTVTKRRPGSTDKTVVKADGYSTSETPIKWVLPVQQSVIDGVEDYYVEFPEDLLEAANLKEGDSVEWVDNKNGSYTIRKVNKNNA